jgi:predicted metalloprotease with PDZ domain
MGDVWLLQIPGGLLVGESAAGRRVPVPFNTPAYDAGLDSGDVVIAIDGRPATMAAWSALSDRAPGQRVAVRIRRRDGRVVNATATLAADPSLQIVDLERGGGTLTPAQRAFRDAWFGSRGR